MKKFLLLVWVAVVALFFCQCSSKDEGETEYNEHVVGFTSGNISRKASVFLILSEDLDASVMEKRKPNKFMSISPSVKGEFSYFDAHTIVFTPGEDMAYNTTYTITADLDELYDDDSKKFHFTFQTYPFRLTANFESFTEAENGDYVYDFSVRSLDVETLDVVKSVVKITEGLQNVKAEWSSQTSQLYSLKLSFTPTKEQTVTLSTKDMKEYQLETRDLVTVAVPDPNKLSVFDVRYVSENTKYILVTFNKRLDPKQNKHGLAYLLENESIAVEASGNTLKLFPDNYLSGDVTLFLSKAIKSKSGLQLQEDITRKIQLKQIVPEIQFVDNGNIIPQTNTFIVPFRSIYMRGVKVKVYRIFKNNIPSMMQMGPLSDYSNLKLLGRPVAVKTFFLDETLDLTKWQTCAIDLSDVVKAEPGCVYRVELYMDYRLTAWPGADVTCNKEDFVAEDKVEMAALNRDFDSNDNWYYMNSNCDYNNYIWDEHDDPAKASFYYDKNVGKNIMATNIGLLALAPSANKLTVVATNIPDAKPLSAVEITVYNKQMQVIGKGTTDKEGRADFSIQENIGAPYFVLAQKGTDVSTLRVLRGEELSTSTFDVAGCEVQGGLKGYIYGERGVWRPGDTIYLSFMLNDKEKTLPENHPVVLEVSNPLGQKYTKQTKTKGVCGIYTFEIPIDESAPTGSWLATIQVGGSSFNKRLRIETIKPNRLKIDLNLPKMLVAGNQTASLYSEWLTGGSTHNLKYDVSAKFVEGTTSFKSFADYVFEDRSKSFESREEEIDRGVTDAFGRAMVNFNMPNVSEAPGKLTCNVTTRVYEASGEFSTDVQFVEYSPYVRYVGIKAPKSERDYLLTNTKQTFNVAAVNSSGEAVNAAKLNVEVYKVEWYWWWNCSADELANYTNSSYNRPCKSLEVTTNANGKASFDLNIANADWGTYLIRVVDPVYKHSSSVLAWFDYDGSQSRAEEGSETPVTVSLQTDKDEYKPGETIHVTIPSTNGSRAVLSICNSAKILDMRFVECHDAQTSVSFKATDEMMPNVYVTATIIQPYNHTLHNDVPIRLYGVKPVTVNSSASHLAPQIVSSDEVKPMAPFSVTVSEKDGKAMAYTLAIVDEGLLDLTRFKTPDAWPVFNAKESLGLRLWDLYGMICGAYGGSIDQMFSIGGDESLYDGPKAVVNRFKPMVHFSGPFYLEKGKKKTHTITVPNYNGRVRVMVVASDGSAFGSSEKSVFVKKSLMVAGTMPRQIGVNDEMTVSATIFATDKNIKNVQTTITCSGGLQVVGGNTVSTNFNAVGDKTVQFKIKAGSKAGVGHVTITSSAASEKATYSADITIRSVSQHITRVDQQSVKAGNSYNSKVTAPGSSNQQIRMEVSNVPSLNIAGRTSQLIQYPHGCAEQITSKAMAQMYLKDFSAVTLSQKNEINKNINDVIQKLAKYQTSDGGMAYWPGNAFADQWVSAYVLLFLDKASKKGYYVNNGMKSDLKKYVSSQVRNWKSNVNEYESQTIAYALYVLSEYGSPEKSTMNRMKESAKQLSATTLNYLAASYALIGQKGVAKTLYSQQPTTVWQWCTNDVINLLAQTLLDDVAAAKTASNVAKSLSSNKWMSTSEIALSLYVMNAYYQKNEASGEMNFVVSTNNKEFAKITTDLLSWNDVLANNTSSVEVRLNNKGKGTLYVTTIAEGTATQEPVKSVSNGLAISVTYDKDVTKINQGEICNIVYTITNTSGTKLQNIAVTNILPAGFEALTVQDNSVVDYKDVRDDRILSYINTLGRNEQVTIRATLSATYAGKYYLPAITAECMYNNSIFGCTDSGECEIR
ncbi:MAG: MG2 domain-containing protein [Bacteroidales bacterium]|nr:MG2 domain-containing protein [Bacteroidales bacterium]